MCPTLQQHSWEAQEGCGDQDMSPVPPLSSWLPSPGSAQPQPWICCCPFCSLAFHLCLFPTPFILFLLSLSITRLYLQSISSLTAPGFGWMWTEHINSSFRIFNFSFFVCETLNCLLALGIPLAPLLTLQRCFPRSLLAGRGP